MNNQDFTNGSIFKKMIKFMLPILGALMLQAMYSAVDLLIVGRFGTPEGISGVATGSSVISLVTFTIAAISAAVTVLIGQYIGSGRKEEISETVGNAVVLFLIIAAALTFCLLTFARPIANVMQTPKDAVDVTVQYIRICGGGYIFIMLYNFISSIFRGYGDSKTPLLFVAIACGVNIAGDLILVAGFKMNVTGAAIATVAAQAVSVLLSFIIIRKKKDGFALKKENFRLGRKTGDILKLGVPLIMMELLTQGSFLALCAFVNHIGLEASSGYGVAQKIMLFIMLLPSSLMQCMSPFISQNYGAGLQKRAKKGMLCGILIGIVFGGVICVIVLCFTDQLSGVFTTERAYIENASAYLRGFVLDTIITSLTFSFCGYFNGHGKSFFVMIQGLVQSLGFRLPLTYIACSIPGLSMFYVGAVMPVASLAGLVFCVIYYIYLNKKGNLYPVSR